VLLTAMTIIVLVMSLQWLARRQHRLTAQVSIADPLIESQNVKTKDTTVTQTLPDGEVERTALRVREVSALVLGLTLYAVNEGLQQRPVNSVESLLSRFASRGLLPPGLQAHTAQGALESPLATLYVRYRPLPLGVEVVSLSKDSNSGSSLLGRLITNAADEPSAALFLARSRQSALPAPFASSAEIVALNWSSEPLRERLFTPQELAQLNTWLQTNR
jgi:hypothetical protein